MVHRATVAAFALTLGLTVAAQQDTEPEKGEQLLNASCISCHDLRPIETSALDKDGWTKNVEAMIEKGADVRAADRPILIDYLVKTHGPLPDGPGKNVVLNVCTMCHTLQRVRGLHGDRDQWEEVLGTMLNEGAPLTEQDFPVVLNYLARNFGAR
jgi:cytochrome c5